jgi:hypothetical protein
MGLPSVADAAAAADTDAGGAAAAGAIGGAVPLAMRSLLLVGGHGSRLLAKASCWYLALIHASLSSLRSHTRTPGDDDDETPAVTIERCLSPELRNAARVEVVEVVGYPESGLMRFELWTPMLCS